MRHLGSTLDKGEPHTGPFIPKVSIEIRDGLSSNHFSHCDHIYLGHEVVVSPLFSLLYPFLGLSVRPVTMSYRDRHGRVPEQAEVPLFRSPNCSIRYDPYNNTQTTKYTDLDVTVVEPIKRSHDRGPSRRPKTKVLSMTTENVRKVLGDDAPQDPESSSSEEDEEPQYTPPTQHRGSRQAPRSSHLSGAHPR